MSLSILTVHAHPDDESSKGPGTINLYASQGVRTTLVCCTGGEEGDILNPAMERPEVKEDLASVRRSELDLAAVMYPGLLVDFLPLMLTSSMKERIIGVNM